MEKGGAGGRYECCLGLRLSLRFRAEGQLRAELRSVNTDAI